MQADLEEAFQDLKWLRQQLQQEENSHGLIARIQESAALTSQQSSIVLEALAANAQHSRAAEIGRTAPSLTATLQRLAAESCHLQTLALVAYELRDKLGPAPVEAGGASHKHEATGRGSDAAPAHALTAALSAVAQMTSDALKAFQAAGSLAHEGSLASTAGTQTGNVISRNLQPVLSCLESSSKQEVLNAPWSQEKYSAALRTARDQVWGQLQDAVMSGAGTEGSGGSIQPDTLPLLEAAASIAPVRPSESSKG